MVKALLCDLDGTLLDIDFNGFMKEYLRDVSRRFADCIPPERFQRQIMVSMAAAVAKPDNERTMLQAFLDDFGRALPLPEDALARFEDYYKTDFPRLSYWGRPVPGARELIEAALARGIDVVVATAPFYPELPVRERLRWAGLDDVPFRFISSSEVMRRSKPFPEYYLEIAERIGARPEECLMIGDETIMDGAAARVGMRVALVGPDRGSFSSSLLESPALKDVAVPDGSLPRYANFGELRSRLQQEGIL
ncbi:MAG: hypothetical protein BAA04_03135 [Firmicutes bacterium ZCTH02-B6]|nr:MAG: hypothetical protein BAA04_03135 [Firmicutes bacterium ZCTH02-B6]